jgi:single-strand DNA-binding protein
MPSVHDGHPAPRSITIQTSKTHLEEHPITLSKGARVVVASRLRTDRWETSEGEKRSRMVMDADDVGASMTFATLAITRGNGAPARDAAPEDPWATATRTRPAATPTKGTVPAAPAIDPPF